MEPPVAMFTPAAASAAATPANPGALLLGATKQRLRSVSETPLSPVTALPPAFSFEEDAPKPEAAEAAPSLDSEASVIAEMLASLAPVSAPPAVIFSEDVILALLLGNTVPATTAAATEEPAQAAAVEVEAPAVVEEVVAAVSVPVAEEAPAPIAAAPAADGDTAPETEAAAPEAAAVAAPEPTFEESWSTLVHDEATCTFCKYMTDCGYSVAEQQGTCGVCKEERALIHSTYDFGIEHWPKPTSCFHLFCRECLEQWVSVQTMEMNTKIRCPMEGCSCILFPDDIHRVSGELFTKHIFLTSRDYTTRLAGTNTDSELAAWLQDNSKACPRCHVLISRSEGCSYMVCHCGTQFCYSCGCEYDTASHDYCS